MLFLREYYWNLKQSDQIGTKEPKPLTKDQSKRHNCYSFQPKRLGISLVSAAALLFINTANHAQAAYPDRTVKIVVPFAAGGFTDIAARVIGQKLTEILGQAFIVENKPGAGSTIGTDLIAKSPADGYTLGLISANHVTSHHLYKNLSYHPLTSFTPIAKVADSPYALLVNAELPVNNVNELIELIKSNKKPIHMGTSGNGSTQHLFGLLFMEKTDSQMEHVPYKGSAQAMQDLSAGFVDVSFAAISNSLPQIRAGHIKPLAVTSRERSPYLPDTPSLHEAGVKDYEGVVWLALVGPKGLDANIVAVLEKAITQSLQDPVAIESLASAGVDVRLSNAVELQKYMEEEEKLWGDLVQGINLKID